MLVPLFFVIGFAACIIGAYHKPHPNDIKVGVVGPAAQTAPLRAGIEKAAGSAFDISQVATVAEAAHDVRQRDLNAAFVPTADPKQPATVIVAERRRPHRRDGGRDARPRRSPRPRARSSSCARSAPWQSGDEIGLGVFMFMIVCTICGYLAPTILETVAPALAPSRRYAIIAATAPSWCRRSPT